MERWETLPPTVRRTALTSAVKVFLERPAEGLPGLQEVIRKALKDSHPDIQDRGIWYYRLLETGPSQATSQRPSPSDG